MPYFTGSSLTIPRAYLRIKLASIAVIFPSESTSQKASCSSVGLTIFAATRRAKYASATSTLPFLSLSADSVSDENILRFSVCIFLVDGFRKSFNLRADYFFKAFSSFAKAFIGNIFKIIKKQIRTEIIFFIFPPAFWNRKLLFSDKVKKYGTSHRNFIYF